MHIQTHFMSCCCFANCLKLNNRERFFAIVIGILPDIDGLSYVFGQEAYWSTHHIYGHNLLFALVTSIIFTIFSQNKIKAFGLFLFLLNIHFLMDFLGSGPGWTIPYFLPFSHVEYQWLGAWNFDGWQNKVAGLIFFIWTILIAVFQKRTPLEFMMPELDKKFVKYAQKLKKQN